MARYSAALKRRLAIVCSLVVYLLVISLVLAALLTEFWVETQALKRDNQVSELSYVNSGLFSGLREIDYGTGARKQYFSGLSIVSPHLKYVSLVLEEIHNEVSFIGRSTWIFIIFFIALGLLWSFIGLIIALLNTLIDDVTTIVGPNGLHVWSSLACKCHSLSPISDLSL